MARPKKRKEDLGASADADRVLSPSATEPVPVSAHSGDAPLRGDILLGPETLERIRRELGSASRSIGLRWLSGLTTAAATFNAGIHASEGNWGWVVVFVALAMLNVSFFILNEMRPLRSKLSVEITGVKLRVGRG